MVATVQTAVRIKPPISNKDNVLSVNAERKQVSLDNKGSCTSDYVFNSDTNQGALYDACMVNRINKLFEGTDVYILACGGCLSGKSHTLFELNHSNYEISYGLIPLAVHHIFNTLSRFQLHNYFRCSVYINFIEIVNEEINDLLSVDRNKKFTLATSNKGTKFITGIENILCRNVSEVFGCLKVGLQSKKGNNSDHESCNSHTLFSINVYQQWVYAGGLENRVSKATFLDLGSSDFSVDSCEDVELDPGINFLSKILSSISSERTLIRSNQGKSGILYSLIKDAFTVSQNTLLICCLSPDPKDTEKSLSYINLVQQVKEQFNTQIPEEPSYDSNTTTSSVELDNYGHHDVYISMASSQWMKLILNAEGLFQKLSNSGLSKEAKQQVDTWLCLKQEYDECIIESSITPFQKVQKSLECIKEVTESESNSSSCLTSFNSDSKENSKTDLDIKNDTSFSLTSHDFRRKQDFSSRLETLLSKFKTHANSVVEKNIEELCSLRQNVNEEIKDKLKDQPQSPVNYRRRKTILPGDVNQVLNKFEPSTETHLEKDEVKQEKHDSDMLQEFVTAKYDPKISRDYISKEGQIDLIILDLEGAHKRIEELNQLIKVKEEFINEMIQNSSARNTCKVKLQRKLYKLEEEYNKMRANLVRAEKAVKCGDSSAHVQIEKFKSLSHQYEKRLRDLELVKQLASDSAKKVIELESSLFNSKKKLQKLLKQLKKEEEHKAALEKKMEEQKRLKGKQFDNISGSDLKRLKQIEEEESKLKSLRESSNKIKRELLEQRGILEKRESFFKEKVNQEKICNQQYLTGSSSSNEALKIVKYDGNMTEDIRDSLRHEIRNLRKTRDYLVDQRRRLDVKINKEKVFTASDERKFLECDEAIDAVDSAIEYKNEIMFGHMQVFDKREDWVQPNELLIERLMNLSQPEMRTLLAKYFQKVVDLRDSGHKLEQQLAEQDLQIEAQAWKIQTLTNALQQANIETERRLIMIHREHQEKLHLMFRQYAGDTSGTSSVDKDDSLSSQNKALKHRVHELEGLLCGTQVVAHKPSSTALSIPRESIKKLQNLPTTPVTTTKVTRSKNKLIIQQQKAKKRSK